MNVCIVMRIQMRVDRYWLCLNMQTSTQQFVLLLVIVDGYVCSKVRHTNLT